MYKTLSNFNIACFRNQVITCLLLTVLSFSFLPSVTPAQQPTATIKTLSGNVLIAGQAATVGTVLQAGDTIQTQAGALVVLELSDGSELHLGEKTQITVADLAQTSTGARVSRVKLLWGRIRAFLSPQHQIEGSSFDIETPNALIGVKFSEPDIEVSYNLEKAETVGIAHTVELLAKNLLTDKEVLVPVGSTVIITAVGMKVIAGIVGVVGASSAGSTGTGTASTTASTGSTGMGTGTKVAIGAGAAAAAGGVAAIAASSGDENGGDTDGGMVGDGAYTWEFSEQGTTTGCINLSLQTGLPINGPYRSGFSLQVEKTGDIITGSGNCPWENSLLPTTVEGTISGTNVQFRRYGTGWTAGYTMDWNYLGTIQGNRITGTFSGGGGNSPDPNAVGCSTSGTFTVTIE